MCRQTKPGGWIEVVETGEVSVQARQQRLPRGASTDTPEGYTPSKSRLAPGNTAVWIQQQLLETGFVDVEEKGCRPPPSTAGICFRIAGIGRILKSWCLGFLGMRWNCDSLLFAVTGHIPNSIDEKDPNSVFASFK